MQSVTAARIPHGVPHGVPHPHERPHGCSRVPWKPCCAQGARCSIAVEAVSAGSQHAPGLLAALQQAPLLRDACATAVATAGAVSLIKVFEKLTKEGVIGQVQPWHLSQRAAARMCVLHPLQRAWQQSRGG